MVLCIRHSLGHMQSLNLSSDAYGIRLSLTTMTPLNYLVAVNVCLSLCVKSMGNETLFFPKLLRM